MNLYKILFQHYSQKDSEVGMYCLLLAENDEQVYEWFKSDPRDIFMRQSIYSGYDENEKYVYDEKSECWRDDYGEEVSGWYDEDGNPEIFKDRMLRLKGEMFDDEVELSDLYYGKTLVGWELVKENVITDYSELIECGIVKTINQ